MRAVVIEVSAQALTRHRVDGIVFDVVGFTNLTHDHFDDYGDMDEYFAAKRELFEPDRARRGVVHDRLRVGRPARRAEPDPRDHSRRPARRSTPTGA